MSAVAGGAIAAVIFSDNTKRGSSAKYSGSVPALLFRLLISMVALALFAYWVATSPLLAESITDACQPSPATAQGCTPEGGVSAIRADVNFTGGAHE